MFNFFNKISKTLYNFKHTFFLSSLFLILSLLHLIFEIFFICSMISSLLILFLFKLLLLFSKELNNSNKLN
jgi:hypothetical protein